MKEFEWPSGTTGEQRRLVSQILWLLREHGPIKDPESGRANKLLVDLLIERGADYSQRQTWVKKMLTEMDGASAKPKFGRLIKRERSQTRTQSIALAINPEKVPFPPSPFGATAVSEDEEVAAFEDADTDTVFETLSLERVELIEPDVDDDEEPPGTDLVPVGHIGAVDRLLYAQSAITEAIDQIVAERIESQHDDLVKGMAAFERLVRENEELRTENRTLHASVRQLQRAVQQRR